MLATFMFWVYQILIILPFGILLITLNRKLDVPQEKDSGFWMIGFLTGLAIITSLVSVFSLFMNIGWQAHLFFLIAAIAIWLYLLRKKHIKQFMIRIPCMGVLQKISLGIMIVATGIVLFAATNLPSNPDTGIYHAQTIRWIETYKAVPGLANLHTRLGYNSSWLVANALFSLSFLKIQSFHILPSTLFIACLFYFYSGIFSVLGGGRKLSDLARTIYFIAALFFLSTEISSPGTDLPVTLLIWVISVEWVKLLEKPQDEAANTSKWLVLISLFCVTIKLSSAPILLFPLWYLIQEGKQKRLTKSIVFVGILAVLVYIPFISRNMILSGHLFYPGFSFDPINLDWSIPQDIVEREKKIIHWFALMPRVSFQKFTELTWQVQYKAWFFDQLPRHKAILAYLALMPFLWIFMLIFPSWKAWFKKNKSYLFILASLYAGILFWLVSAPTFRFGYGFLLAAVTLSGVPIIFIVTQQRKYLNTILQIAIILFSVFVCYKSFHNSTIRVVERSQLFIPRDYPKYSTVPCEYGDFKLPCPAEYDACWYDPFPCGIRSNENLFMRGDDWSEGFTQKTQSDF